MQDFASRTTCTSRTTRQVPLKKAFPANSKRCSVTMWYLILSHWNITQSPLAPIAWIKRLISPVYHSYNLKHTQQDYHDLNSQTDSENLLSFTSLQTPGLPIRTEIPEGNIEGKVWKKSDKNSVCSLWHIQPMLFQKASSAFRFAFKNEIENEYRFNF